MYNRLSSLWTTYSFALVCLFAGNRVAASDNELSLLFVGDVMGNKPQINAAHDPETDTYNYHPCFQYIKPVVEKADVAIANLELTLPGGPPYTGFPMFRSPNSVAEALKYAGFDVLVTANNHSNDSGLQGVVNTIEVAQSLGFLQTGTFKDADDRAARYPLMIEKNGFYFALLNYTFHTNGLSTKPPSIVNRIDRAQIIADIAAAKDLGAEFIIGFFHWGDEYKNFENAFQREWAQTAANLGMDMVIGAHPHVVQPVKMLTAKRANGSTKEVPVAYSLGNFISNAISTNTSMGLMLETILQRDTQTCQISVSRINYMPVWRYLESKTVNKRLKNTYYALPASAFHSDTLNVLQMPAAAALQLANAVSNTYNILDGGLAIEKPITVEQIYGNQWEEALCHALNYYSPRQSKTIASAVAKPSKTTIALTVALSLDPKPALAEKAVEAPAVSTYKIQFQAARTDKQTNHPFTNISIEKNDQGWYRYLSGSFTSKTSAQKHLQEVKLQGYDQAFIAVYQNGKRKN